MTVQSQIPAWLQWAWAIAGLLVAAGGLCWILFIFWPYLRWSKRTMQVSLDLARNTAEHIYTLERIVEIDIRPLIREASSLVNRIAILAGDIEQEKIVKRLGFLCERAGFYLGVKKWTDDFRPVEIVKED